ncbi:MAG TPA: sensor histidine kinase [Salinivirgaceae bacterium]|nr:sensor histidine kinase [Salinivirgaceae bacterium]
MIRIRHRIIILTLLVSATTSLIVGVISIAGVSKIIKKEAEDKLLMITITQSLEFETELRKITDLSLNLESILKGVIEGHGLPQSEREMFQLKSAIDPIVQNYLRLLKPRTCWIIFNPGLVPGKHTISYEDLDADGIYIREPEYSVNDFDLNDSSMEWWTKAIKVGSVWTKPYFWENWNVELISYSRAVFHEGKLVACVGSDFDLTMLKEKLSRITVYQSGNMAIWNEELKLVYHPYFYGKAISSILDSSNYHNLKTDLQRRDQGIFIYQMGNENKILAYKKLSNGWYMASIAPWNEIFASIRKVWRTILLIIGLGAFLGVLMSLWISVTITSPVQQLVYLFQQGSEGYLTIRAPRSKIYEINALAQHFNHLMNTVQQTIEQLRQSEEELKQAKEKAEESDRLKSEFLSNISHEIRTPLNAIVGFCQLITTSEVDNSTKDQFLQYIYLSSSKLTDMVEDIVLFSQIHQNTIQPKPKEVDIIQTLHSIFDETERTYKEYFNRVNLILSIPASISSLNLVTDTSMIHRIFRSLISNAVKFTKEGYIKFGISSIENEKVYFFVEDTGIGIPEDQKDRIFMRFYKYQPFNDHFAEGIGLGLSLSKDLANMLGGDIWIESQLNIGTKVIFTIHKTHSDKPI